MIRMIGRLKQNAGWLILTLALLVLQANCDLSLPEYTSLMVDTGIQQKGIEDAVPSSLRPESFEAVLAVADPENTDAIESAYRLEKSLYRLKEVSGDEREKLRHVMGEAELLLTFAAQQKIDISTLPETQVQAMRAGMKEKLKEYPDMMADQAAIAWIQEEYKAQKIDLNQLQRSYMLKTGVKMLLVALLSMMAAIIVTFLSSRIAAALARDLRKDVYRKVLTFSASEMDRFSTASLITRSTNDIQQVQIVMTMLFRVVVFAPVMAIGAIIRVAHTGAYLRWILIVAVVCVAVLMAVIFTVAMPRFKKLQIKIDRINLIAREMLTGVPVIRAFGTEQHEEERFDRANHDFMKTNLFVSRLMAVMMPMMMLIMNGVMVLIVYSGSRGIDLGKLQVGDMMAFMQYAMHVIISFTFITSIAIFMPRAQVAAARIFEVLDTQSVIRNCDHPDQIKEDRRGLLEFKDVSFSYPGAEEKALSHITFTAHPGETIAFIGNTGSGKSTLVNLIPRFYDVTEGSVCVDGVDIRHLDIHDLRDRIGFVPQKAVLFSGTVATNMRFGKEDAKEEEMRQALEIAQAEDFVYTSKVGTDMTIAQGGTNVSGGQKQRLSIARAVIKKPEFYVFDDSFSALDFKTDAKLRRRLKETCAGATTLIIAQRISTIMHADQIIVLHDGKMIGCGTHEELLDNCAAYRQMADLQLAEGGDIA